MKRAQLKIRQRILDGDTPGITLRLGFSGTFSPANNGYQADSAMSYFRAKPDN
jgi:hypothetical protein